MPLGFFESGQSLSGNVLEAGAQKAADLAGQNWGQYQAGLQPYLQYPAQFANNQATLDARLGEGLNTSFMGQGGAANTTQTTIGNNNAGAEMNNYKVGANQLNGLLGIGQIAMGMPPTSFGAIGGGSVGGGGGGGGGSNAYANNPLATGIQSLFSGFGGGQTQQNPYNTMARSGLDF